MEHLAWPLAVIIIVFVFRKQISNLIERIQKISKSGIQTHPQQPQETTDRSSAAEELMRAFDSITLREQEENIRRNLEQRGITEQQERINILIRHLAAAQLIRHFEYVNNMIWGSQIRLLRFLNTLSTGATVNMVRPFYEQANLPGEFAERYPIESYLDFLTSNNLVILEGDHYKITQLGRDFLQYLIAMGRSEDRPF